MYLFVALLTSSYVLFVTGSEGFTVVPESLTVHVRDTAEFRCRYPDATDIEWRVDGTPVSIHAPPEINPSFVWDEDNNLIDILSIIAITLYNNSEIVCVAKIGTRSVSTLPAILRVLPEGSHPTSIPTGFTLAPESQNITLGATAQFTCQRRDGDVVWRIDGQPVNNHRDVIATSQGGLHILTIANTSRAYNGSEVQCKAMFDDSREPEFTTPAILQLQGLLDPVSNVIVARNSSTLSWTPPFSLDLTGVDPDIAYCVDVYNITCGRRDLIISDCNVTEPSYTSDVIASDGYIYEYIVTPRSNVDGARNGTPSQTLRERFSRFSHSISKRKNIPTRNVQLAFLNSEPNRPVPSSYTVLLESFDGLENMELKTTKITTEGNVIVVDVDHRLPWNRVWNCTLWAYNCQQNTILSGIELSTHDIQNISVSSPHLGQIRVTGDFIQGSKATGLLVTFVNGNATDIQHHLISKDVNVSGIDGVISGLADGQYTVSVFVVSKNGLPFERAAAKPIRTSVENAAGSTGEHPSSTIDYKLDRTSDGVCVTCTYLDSSVSDCVAVVHQQISQLSSSGLMNIESSHKFTRSGDTAYGCIEGVNLEDHEVRVIDGQLVIPQAYSSVCTRCIIGSVLAILFIILMSVVSLIPVVLILKKKYCSGMSFAKPSGTKLSMQDLEGGSSARAKGNYYTEIPTLKSSEVEHTSGETAPVVTESHGPGETNDPQPDSQNPLIFPPTSFPPVTPQAAAVEETVATPEAKEIELDHCPNHDTPADNKLQCANVDGLINPQVPFEEEMAATGKLEQDTSFYSPSPPTENLLPHLGPTPSEGQPLGKEALTLDENSHLDNIDEKDEACTEPKPDEDIKALSEDGSTEELQGEDDTEMMTIEDELKDSQTERSEDKFESATHIDEMGESVLAEKEGETSPQSPMQVISTPQEHQMEVLFEPSEAVTNKPVKESVGDDDLEATFISGNGAQLFHKPVAQSTPLRKQPPSSVPDASNPAEGGTSMFVQSSTVHERMAGHEVMKSQTYITDESDAQTENGTSTPHLIVSKADTNGPQVPEGDSAYGTYGMPGDSVSHSSEPYSEVSNTADSGYDTNLSVKTTGKSEIVCGSEKAPALINDGDGDGKETVSFRPEEVVVQPTMENREQLQLGRFFNIPEEDRGPLVPPQHLDLQ